MSEREEIVDAVLRAGDEAELRSGRTYEDVRFEGLELLEASLRDATFVDCAFEDVDLTMADLAGVALRGVRFARCRLRGVDLGRLRRDAMGIEASFEDCDLGLVHATGADMRACRFEGGRAPEASLAGCDLRGVAFDGVDLAGCRFERCDLRGADLRTARGYRIDPVENRVRGLRVALPEAIAFLGALGLDVDA